MGQDDIYYVVTFEEMRLGLDALERQVMETLVMKMYRARMQRTEPKNNEPRNTDVHR